MITIRPLGMRYRETMSRGRTSLCAYHPCCCSTADAEQAQAEDRPGAQHGSTTAGTLSWRVSGVVGRVLRMAGSRRAHRAT